MSFPPLGLRCAMSRASLLTLAQIFGYDTGQISGFLEMDDFKRRFADTTDPETGDLAFTNGRSGTIVALVSSFGHLLRWTYQYLYTDFL